MSSMFEKLWPSFLEEVTEQLDTLELALLKTNREEIDVNQVFRLFHTIKSSCGMLEFSSMEELAHACEDKLDLVRSGEMVFEVSLIDLLIQSVDGLKGLLAEASKTKSNPRPLTNLVNDMKQYTSSNDFSDVPEIAPASSAQTKEELKTDPADTTEKPKLSPKELEDIIRESLSQAIQDFSKDKNINKDSVILAIDVLIDVCDMMDYFAISKLLEKLKIENNVNNLSKRLYIISEMLDRLLIIDEIANIDELVSTSRKEMIDLYGDQFQEELKTLITLINVVSKKISSKEITTEDSENLLRELTRIKLFPKSFGFTALYEYINYFYQYTRLVTSGENEPDIYLKNIELLTTPLNLFSLSDYNDDEFNQAIESLIDIYHETSVEVPEDREAALMAEYSWFKELNSRESASIINAIDNGMSVIEIYADLEADREFSNLFSEKIYKCVEVVTNLSTPEELSFSNNIVPTILIIAVGNEHSITELVDQIDSSSSLHIVKINNEVISQEVSGSVSDVESNTVKSINTLRVESNRLDNFVSQVGEMVMLRNVTSSIVNDEEIIKMIGQAKSSIQEINEYNPREAENIAGLVEKFTKLREDLMHADIRVQSTISKMQDEVLELRVVPISMVFNRLPMLVHSLNKDLGKNAKIEIIGENEKIDKSLVDILMEPMMHLVRNALDHGIESAEDREKIGKTTDSKLTIKAETSGNLLNIIVSDNGRGLDSQRIVEKAQEIGIDVTDSSDEAIADLIFEPGFSTSTVLTETSGRGVGMDAVRTKINQVGGTVNVNSTPGVGTEFILCLPLSVAIQGIVLIESGGQKFAIPERNVEEMLSIDLDEIQSVNGQATCLLRGEILPIFNLTALIYPSVNESEPMEVDRDSNEIIIISNGKYRIGLQVDKIDGRQEIFIRDINNELMKVPGFGGASILGNGSVVIILDCENIITIAENNSQAVSDLKKASGL